MGQAWTVGVVGLGKLGAPIAALYAARGHSVIGIDINPRTLDALRRGVPPVPEPGLEEHLKKAGGRLQVTDDFSRSAECRIIFLVTPTPSEPTGEYSLRFVVDACRKVGRALRTVREYRLVVVTSTVLPGDTGGPIRDALEEESGRKCGTDFGLCYNPEFIALGNVIQNLKTPDFVLIGESDARAGDELAAFYPTVLDNPAPIARMNWINAELAKIAVNSFVTTKITYANMLARVCERLPGADAAVVTAAVGLDRRIGKSYLQGGLGYGGPCFPRDNRAFSSVARRVGAPSALAETTDALNRKQVDLILDFLKPKLRAGQDVAVLGLSYKPQTNVVEESQGVALAAALASDGRRVRVYDPSGFELAREALGDRVTYSDGLEACVRGAGMVIVATAWDEFRALEKFSWDRSGDRPVIVDCWRMFDPSRFQGRADYLALGRSE